VPRATKPEDDDPRPLSPERAPEDAAEASLRPQHLRDFVGQRASRENLAVFIEAARARAEALDHVLLHVLFIDEIHRLQPAIEEILYPAMEDFQLDLIIGEGPAARSVRIDLSPFTLVGATTRAGLLATPLRDRFGIPLRLVFYTAEELTLIVARGAEKLGFALTQEGAQEIARRSRGTPRIAGRLLRRVRDFAMVQGDGTVDRAIADAALTRLEVDALGLDAMDRRYLRRIAEHHAGGPVGVETLSAALAEARDTLEDVIEPYLIQEGFVLRTNRGRMLADRGWRHLGLKPPPTSQTDLLPDLLNESS
jgi:Holliday junction DNA helicase RuvB